MPTSDSKNIPVVLHFVWQLVPKRVLDLGAGYGKYGVLFREYIELRHKMLLQAHSTVAQSRERCVQIDAVEGFNEYIGDLHRSVYDHIYVEDILDFVKREWEYDFIYMGDVLEHIDKRLAQEHLLPALIRGATMGVLIAVPSRFAEQEAVFGNSLEQHRSSWCARDFKKIAPWSYVGHKGSHLFAFLTRDAGALEKVKVSWLRSKLRAFKSALVDDL